MPPLWPARAGVRLSDLSRAELIRYVERLEASIARLLPSSAICDYDRPGLHCFPGNHIPGCFYFNPIHDR
jgi:hypothetical protein